MGRDDRATTKRDAGLRVKAARKERDRRDGSGFIALPFVVVDSPGYRRATHTARSLLVDLARAYSGANNGSIWLSRSAREAIGWGSESTFRSALADLIACGLVVETRRGGRNLAAWYGLTWRELDVVTGLDIDPKQWRRGAYQSPEKALDASGKARTAKAAEARSVAAGLRACYKPAPSHGATPRPTAPSDGATDPAPCTVGRCSEAGFLEFAAPSHGAYLDGCHLPSKATADDAPQVAAMDAPARSASAIGGHATRDCARCPAATKRFALVTGPGTGRRRLNRFLRVLAQRVWRYRNTARLAAIASRRSGNVASQPEIENVL